MDVKAIAWDIDGTLIDSEPLYEEAINYVNKKILPNHGDDKNIKLQGMHLKDIWKLLGIQGVDFQGWKSAVENYYLNNINKLKINDNSPEIIKNLNYRGMKQACVSNSSREIACANLDYLKVTDYLEFIISVNDVLKGKPYPDPYKKAIEKFNILEENIIAIEDSITGVSSAMGANLNIFLYDKNEVFKNKNYNLINNLKELYNFI